MVDRDARVLSLDCQRMFRNSCLIVGGTVTLNWPLSFSAVVRRPSLVNSLQKFFGVPHCILNGADRGRDSLAAIAPAGGSIRCFRGLNECAEFFHVFGKHSGKHDTVANVRITGCDCPRD
jgi:hypothetical protein